MIDLLRELNRIKYNYKATRNSSEFLMFYGSNIVAITEVAAVETFLT